MFEYLVFSLMFLAIWLALFFTIQKKSISKTEMLKVSVFTAPFGLLEPLFVPEYWNPPTLFNLAFKTGFDLESVIFGFAFGGIAAVLYEVLFKVKHTKAKKDESEYHILALISPPLIFITLELLTKWNVIYTASMAFLLGAIAYMSCQPNLKQKMIYNGIIFTILYFLVFLLFNLLFPNYVQSVWNFQAISGILILGVPLEELMIVLPFGMLWSGLYDHTFGYRISKKR